MAMYPSGGYGFPNAQGAGLPQFNNQAPPQHQQQNIHMQQQPGQGAPGAPGGQQQQQQQQQPQQQQMMFNPQQFAAMGGQAAFAQGAPGGGGGVMGGPGPAGMMQNPAMQHMASGGQMPGFQQGAFMNPSYAGGPQQFNPNFMVGGGGMQGFPMNTAGMTPQQQHAMMQQRMAAQQAQQANAGNMTPGGTPQRPMSASQGTPNSNIPAQQGQGTPQSGQQTPQQQPQQGQQQQQQQQQQSQAQAQQLQRQQQQLRLQQQQQQQQQQPSQQPPTPQPGQQPTPHGQPQQAPNQNQQFPTSQPGQPSQTPTTQQPGTASSTPQTPTFPGGPGMGMMGAMQVPTSPQFTAVERERFAILLDINQELLFESMQLQNTQMELKKELAAAGAESASEADKKKVEEAQQDFTQCLRRLNANLQYLAALADRKSKLPPCPAILSAPPLNMAITVRYVPENAEGAERPVDSAADRQERNKYLRSLYEKLQGLFPGIDPKKEPAFSMQNARPQQQQKQGQQGSPTGQGRGTPQMANAAAPTSVGMQ